MASKYQTSSEWCVCYRSYCNFNNNVIQLVITSGLSFILLARKQNWNSALIISSSFVMSNFPNTKTYWIGSFMMTPISWLRSDTLRHPCSDFYVPYLPQCRVNVRTRPDSPIVQLGESITVLFHLSRRFSRHSWHIARTCANLSWMNTSTTFRKVLHTVWLRWKLLCRW